jgi:hypothetical protein
MSILLSHGQALAPWGYSLLAMAILCEAHWSGLVIPKLSVRTRFLVYQLGTCVKFYVLGLDYPYIMALLPNDTIEIHNIETQAIVQIISAPPDTSSSAPSDEYPRQRLNLVSSVGRYLVPSTQRSDKMRKTSVRLLRASEPIVPSQ